MSFSCANCWAVTRVEGCSCLIVDQRPFVDPHEHFERSMYWSTFAVGLKDVYHLFYCAESVVFDIVTQVFVQPDKIEVSNPRTIKVSECQVMVVPLGVKIPFDLVDVRGHLLISAWLQVKELTNHSDVAFDVCFCHDDFSGHYG